jgi:hypothetical protein
VKKFGSGLVVAIRATVLEVYNLMGTIFQK